MDIKVSNIKDFIGFLFNAIHNGERLPRVLHMSNPSEGAVVFGNEGKIYTKFAYALFTEKLSVLYTGLVKTDEFEILHQKLLDFRNRDGNFRIQIFREMRYDENILYVEEELDVI